ncbi:hypothetical protein [Humisphaera borealis]|uniref:Uncharacterized protein n=1 Tax=Humisphaera borealis TaxID=2807512 RepID=A0A7M2WZB1_9BACT|nr:hypothetical protein [Humisphaera borealis]QOV90191.1 hypothetical protein IPV69_02115 [Humisphaera borealis]
MWDIQLDCTLLNAQNKGAIDCINDGDYGLPTVTKQNVSSEVALAAMRHDSQPLLSMTVRTASLEQDSYFSDAWDKFRNNIWNNARSSEYVPPLLRFSRWCDDPAKSLIVIGGSVGFDCDSDDVRFCVPDYAVGTIERWLADQLNSSRVVYSRSVFPMAGWRSPRFALEWSPYYVYHRLIDSKHDAIECLESHRERDPLRALLAWTEVRYSDGVSVHDNVLRTLFAGTVLCLPALLWWKQRFAKSHIVPKSSEAVAAVMQMLLQFQGVQKKNAEWYLSNLRKIGLQSRGLMPEGDLLHAHEVDDEDLLTALRALIPPKQLVTGFLLDVSGLDNAMLH